MLHVYTYISIYAVGRFSFILWKMYVKLVVGLILFFYLPSSVQDRGVFFQHYDI